MQWLQHNWQGLVPWVLFVALYIATFKLAWRKLADLVVANATKRHGIHNWRFWWQFVEYRIILLVPYIPFVVFRKHVPTTISKLIFWWVVLMFGMGLLRFVGTKRLTQFLWWVYAYMYDGLLHFYPYRNLVTTVTKRLELRSGMRLLELGCGTGNVIVSAIKDAEIIAVGVDSSKAMLRQAKQKLKPQIKNGQVELICMDALEYLKAQKACSFDCISMVNFLYAVDDRHAIWLECLRVIKPSGKIIVTTSTDGGSRPIILEHLSNASWLELISLRLVGVMIVDFFISELAKAGPFSFPDQEFLLKEVEEAGGEFSDVKRVYGGAENGVNIVFNVKRHNRITD